MFLSSAGFLAYDTVLEAFICPVSLKIVLGTAVFAVVIPSIIADTFPVSGLVVSGKVARLHRGQAAASKKAPDAVKRAIWAANQLGSKPYRHGGGHKSFEDRRIVDRASKLKVGAIDLNRLPAWAADDRLRRFG